MNTIDLVGLRKVAEQAVSDMPEGQYRLAAFQIILKSLLREGASVQEGVGAPQIGRLSSGDSPSSFADRIAVLATEGFFSEPRSLSAILNALAERGWHYAAENVSTPLVRLVRQRQLRRLQVTDAKRRVWKYSLP
jgi:hypothetical protein